jgi:hypothetical protein
LIKDGLIDLLDFPMLLNVPIDSLVDDAVNILFQEVGVLKGRRRIDDWAKFFEARPTVDRSMTTDRHQKLPPAERGDAEGDAEHQQEDDGVEYSGED